MKKHSFITTGDGVRIAYRFDGAVDRPVLVLSNSIATSLEMWDGEIAALTHHFRVLRFDTRGHGESDVPPGPYSLDRLGRDVVELLDTLKVGRVHFCGLSLGGFIGQWVGIHVPERIDRLILANTSSYLGPAEPWNQRIAQTLAVTDMQETAQTFMRNWFPASWIERRDPVVETFRTMVLGIDPKGIAGCFSALRDADLRRTIATIPRPTLVIAGEFDTVTLPGHGELIAHTVPGARLITWPIVHLANIERREEFVRTVIDFVEREHEQAAA
jgi:3-oxoadipate enol-lactonase